MILRLLVGDLVSLHFRVGSIVTSSNADMAGNANPSYWRFAGRRNVDGAVRAASAPMSYTPAASPLAPGQAILTPATGSLLSNVASVIHVNVPEGTYAGDASRDERRRLLKACYTNSLNLHAASCLRRLSNPNPNPNRRLSDVSVTSAALALPGFASEICIAFPALGCGVREWRDSAAAEAAFEALTAYASSFPAPSASSPHHPPCVLLVFIDPALMRVFAAVAGKRFGWGQQREAASACQGGQGGQHRVLEWRLPGADVQHTG